MQRPSEQWGGVTVKYLTLRPLGGDRIHSGATVLDFHQLPHTITGCKSYGLANSRVNACHLPCARLRGVKEIHVIGIGAGDPDQLTLQAVRALGRTDVFFLLDKGEEKADLVRLRELILQRHASPAHRVVVARDPDRDRTAATPGYAPAVDDWRRRRADIYQRLIAEELAEGERGAFLVWGDPALYDSTLGILQDVHARGAVDFDWTVVPGISSVSALAARHRTGLNQVGRPVQITTGRRLADGGLPGGVDDVVVMLDAHQSFGRFTGQDLHIYWGAYVGTPDEILISGPLADVADEIRAVRAEARERKGWIMDTYLLRRSGTPTTAAPAADLPARAPAADLPVGGPAAVPSGDGSADKLSDGAAAVDLPVGGPAAVSSGGGSADDRAAGRAAGGPAGGQGAGAGGRGGSGSGADGA